jgi:hypothetical protein
MIIFLFDDQRVNACFEDDLNLEFVLIDLELFIETRSAAGESILEGY